MKRTMAKALAAAVILVTAFALPGCAPRGEAHTFETANMAPAKPYNRTIFSSMDF